MEINIARWYCCLNPTERLAMILCAGNAGPVTYFVLKSLFDAVWLTATEGSITIRKEIFIEERGLTLGSVPPDDPDGIEVYYMDPEYWDEVNAYMDEFGTTCAEPCKVLTFSS